MRDLVLWLARELVDDKDAVTVETIERDRSTVFELTVAHDDLGRVIGRGGRTAKAFRTVLDGGRAPARAAARCSTSSTDRGARPRRQGGRAVGLKG